MKRKHRIGVFATGFFFLVYGVLKARQHGVFPYLNYKMQPVYPIGVEIAGAIMIGMACLPTGEWLNRILSTRPPRRAHVLKRFPPRHHH